MAEYIPPFANCVHGLNEHHINNRDITRVLGLHHVPSHVGRLTHYFLTKKDGPIYKTGTRIYEKCEETPPNYQMGVEDYAYYARDYLRCIAISIVDYVFKTPYCTQSKISSECLGILVNDDHNWVVSQLLDVMHHHGIVVKSKRGQYTSITLAHPEWIRANQITKVNNTMFTCGHASIAEYMRTKRLGFRSEHELIYTQHLIRNALKLKIKSIEVNKSFENLVGISERPLRVDMFVEYEDGTKIMIEIDSPYSHHKYHTHTIEHDRRKLDYALSMDQHVLVRLVQFCGRGN